MAKARPREDMARHLTRESMEKLIYEANLGKEDSRIASLYWIEKYPQIDIAFEVELDRKTVGKRLRFINSRLAETAEQLAHKTDKNDT